MHPAVYVALIASRETELRTERHHERPVREPRVRPFALRLAIRSRRFRTA
jgi:hypothetical protein